MLQQYVPFYQALSPVEKERFEKSLQMFLQTVRITDVKAIVDDMDAVLIAAAPIIPLFAFDGCE